MSELGKVVFLIALLVLAAWLALRLMVFLRKLMRPAIKAGAPMVNAGLAARNRLDAHVENSLRQSGLEGVADASIWLNKKVQGIGKGLVKAIDATEARVAPKEGRHPD